jgi:carboxypeptidase Taq
MGIKEELVLIKDIQKETILISQTIALLGWDQQTYMPRKGVTSRAEQTAYLNSLIHEKMISPELYSALTRLEKNKSRISNDEKLMVEKMLKRVKRARKIPAEFVKEMSIAITQAFTAWEKAHKNNDFSMFKPYLKKIIELKRKEANYIKLPGHIYNSLLDDFEEGMTVEKIKPVFDELKNKLIVIIKSIEASEEYKKQKNIYSKREFKKGKLMEIIKDILSRMGLTDDIMRFDLVEHPFTQAIGHNDIRITSAFRKNPFFFFFASIHEAGHGLYEKNLPEKDQYNILGQSVSLGLHESQSHFWEDRIAKGESFWEYYFPRFRKHFKIKDKKQFYKEINQVRGGKIRIEADEIHYCLHVILRLECEIGLIDGSISVDDIEKVWNEKTKEYIGEIPKNDNEGVLQDVHWSDGLVGYFPTYAIGVLYSSQIYEAMIKNNPRIESEISKGNLGKVAEWLKENIHKHGSKYTAEEIVKKATGKGLSCDAFISYLNKKYSKIYNL